jgi:type IV secretion system protein VirD4
MVFAPPEQGALILGPPRSGKTSSIVLPNVLAANGPVLAVSTKRDVLDATSKARSRTGRVLLFDPSGAIRAPEGVETIGWSPLTTAASWQAAVLTAEAMVGASRGHGAHGDAVHWNERAGALLAAVFHAAALDGAAMDDVVTAINRRDTAHLLGVLSHSDSSLALDLLVGIAETDTREQSGIFSTASGVLAAYRTAPALASARGDAVDATALLADQATLYVATGAEQQQHVAPIIAGLLRDFRSAEFARSIKHGPDEPPLLLVLDELANIAPLHDLPTLVAEGGSQGVLTLACLQDLSQARQRWGVMADGFFSLFGAKVVLPGIGDPRTLDTLSLLGGDVELESVSVTSPRRRGRRRSTTTVSRRTERALPQFEIARGEPGSAIVALGAQIGRIALTPAHRDPRFRTLVEQSGRAVEERSPPDTPTRSHTIRPPRTPSRDELGR